MNEAQTTDVIVIGGGLAGGLAALALARAGFSVALVDAQDPAAMRAAAFDGRTTALAYGCARVFRRLGLWPAIAPEAEPILDILVTDGRARSRLSDGSSSPFHLHFDSRELEAGEPLGWIVENRVLRDALYDAVAAEPAVALFAPAAVASAEFGPGAARATLEDGRALAAPLVVAADGKNSALRRQAGLRVNRWSYPQTGIVVTVAHERPHKGVAQEFFLPSGPFAILPMTQNRSSLVWTERGDAAPAYLVLDDAAFLKEIENRFGDYLGRLRLAGPRWSYPLSFHLSQRFIAPRLALIGDAARAIHPIAGQGYNLGVKDVAALVETLCDAASLGLDIGHGATLARYERWRRFDSTMLALGTDVLNRLFSNDLAPLRLARAAGMSAVGRVGALRRFFMRQAGADLGELPALMQPGP
ncbi:UbiH/UbiF/VisC/COQ6 family ubiquinone biosynthesis hydroxylase [Amphiplicatus metriothermophilus]|uniref:2-octaprenyl-6-methoxyphenol hydroxylase n=1 Tax=Amphiplicatus metriothermophilus TaxID=1519374 RepID=A0A239PKV5_9PROT|nr:UbiH/UbiF/VisC/COQ6 family ubiquinone biosynthesis hydroxylase [Amphiplicatus metriothermophilus]MBB5517727.1 2-octaprenyl-6-methoxyphenol hydroxylase [Amphiplicatus metriothermophilus]SNT67939.1 2-octaprenyl-6-methoxyphenol hydroxylase [Amphiplicatus metriothermophilus]